MGGGVAGIRTSQEQIIVEAGLWLHSSSLYDSVLEILHNKKKNNAINLHWTFSLVLGTFLALPWWQVGLSMQEWDYRHCCF